jgi:tellurite resistance-related uncharacterized protein
MERAITGFHQDDEGHWVAELSCRHGQHLRHQPPFRLVPWVVEPEGRAAHLGAPLDCPLCDRAELPDGLVLDRRTDTWDQDSVPTGLRRDHRVAAGRWGRLVVEQGELRFRAATSPPIDVVVVAGGSQPIPPEVVHHVETPRPVRFHVEFLVPPG